MVLGFGGPRWKRKVEHRPQTTTGPRRFLLESHGNSVILYITGKRERHQL